MVEFACISPHPPLLLPSVGSKWDKLQVKKTIASLEFLGEKLKKINPDTIIISSPHPDWGIKVPLRFLGPNLNHQEGLPLGISVGARIKGQKLQFKIKRYQTPANFIVDQNDFFAIYPILTTLDSLRQHYEWGQKASRTLPETARIALIASGDLSHRLKEGGPYGFHPDGPRFDKTLINCLKKKDIAGLLKLDEMFPEAGECGLRSFCFILGILEASGFNWQPKILSYEAPFAVGYLVALFQIKS